MAVDEAQESDSRIRAAAGGVLNRHSEFEANIEAIRDLALNAKSHTKPLDDGKAHFLKLVRRWNTHETDDDIMRLLKEMSRLASKALKEVLSRIENGESPSAGFKRTMRLAAQEAIDAHTADSTERVRYSLDFLTLMSRRGRDTVLHSSLLVSAVASFEVLVGHVIRAYLQAFPESLKNSEKNFSTEYLFEFESMDEFWHVQRETRVDKIMRGDVDSWFKWYKDRLAIAPDDLCPNFRELVEIFLTRHAYIHNAGLVNEQYLSTAARLDVEPRATEFEDLPIDQEYLLKAIDLLEVTARLTAFGILKKLESKLPDQYHSADAWLDSGVYDLLEEERYDGVIWLTALIEQVTGSRSDVNRVNVWVALKGARGLEAIEDDVRNWDTSTLGSRFQLVKLALLEDYPAAQAIADKIYATDELSRADWTAWPVLKGLREWVAADPERGRFLLRDPAEPSENPE